MEKVSGGKLTFREKITLALPGPASVIGPIIIHNTLMKFLHRHYWTRR